MIIILVATLFQSARNTFLTRDQWVEVHNRVKELLTLAKTREFMKALKEAHAPVPEKIVTEEENEEENQDDMIEELERVDKFEIERSVFPSLSTALERMDENLWKSY